MCDYSLTSIQSRPAVVGDKLITTDFAGGTRGFAPANGDPVKTAVCVLPGTEIAFAKPIRYFNQDDNDVRHSTAIFRQINRDQKYQHHDALEFPNGIMVLLTFLTPGQDATVLQLPAAPKTKAEAEAQKRIEVVG